MRGEAIHAPLLTYPFALLIMKKWLSRLGCLLLILLWLLAMTFPFVAINLARNEQLQIGTDAGTHLRLFLISEEDFNGIAVEWTRETGGLYQCRQTSVSYWMWEGEGENVSYCQ